MQLTAVDDTQVHTSNSQSHYLFDVDLNKNCPCFSTLCGGCDYIYIGFT